jgi:hypothetical protein
MLVMLETLKSKQIKVRHNNETLLISNKKNCRFDYISVTVVMLMSVWVASW